MIQQRDDPGYSFEPMLCRKSVEILAEQPVKKEFLERNQDLLKKRLALQSSQSDPQGPFSPQITDLGAR